MADVSSVVVSDTFAATASNSALERTGEGDIVYCNWETYLASSFEETVWVFDLNLMEHVQENRFGKPKIEQHKERFARFFEKFGTEIRLLMKAGDVVVIVDGVSLDVTVSTSSGNKNTVSSNEWAEDLNLYNIRESVGEPPEIHTDASAPREYLYSSESHFAYDLNSDIITDPTILAKSRSHNLPAAFATHEIPDATGHRIETDGALVVLPQPTAIKKPLQMMRSLVETGWHFHEESRPVPIPREEPSDMTTLSIPMSELDEGLVEVSWSKYARGEYRDAAARACQHLEHRVRDLTDENRSGASLMNHAFSTEYGPLSMGEQPGERKGVLHLYSGAIQGIWNPLHHRPTEGDGEKYLDGFGQQEAHDVISYVNFLLSLLPEDTKTDPDTSEPN